MECKGVKKEEGEDVLSTRTGWGRKNTTRWLLCASGEASKHCRTEKVATLSVVLSTCYNQESYNPMNVYICNFIRCVPLMVHTLTAEMPLAQCLLLASIARKWFPQWYERWWQNVTAWINLDWQVKLADRRLVWRLCALALMSQPHSVGAESNEVAAKRRGVSFRVDAILCFDVVVAVVCFLLIHTASHTSTSILFSKL